MRRSSLLFALCFAVAVSGFVLPEKGSTERNEVTIRVTATSDTAASFDAFFRTETDTLISKQSAATPKTFKIEKTQFTGYIRPLEEAQIKVGHMHSGLRGSSTSRRPVRITRNGSNVSSTFVDPEDLPESLQ